MMSQRVAGRRLGQSGRTPGLSHGSLKNRLVKVMSPTLPCLLVDIGPCRGKDPLPAQLLRCPWVLPRERVGKLHIAARSGQIPLVPSPGPRDVFRQWLPQRNRKHRHPVLPALTVSHHNLIPGKVDILHPEPAALRESQAGAVQQRRHEPRNSMDPTQDSRHLDLRQNNGNADGCPRADNPVQPLHISPKHFPIEKEESAQGLVLCRWTDASMGRKAREKLGHLRCPHFLGMALPMVEDISSDPPDVALLGLTAVVARPQGHTDPIQKLCPL